MTRPVKGATRANQNASRLRQEKRIP